MLIHAVKYVHALVEFEANRLLSAHAPSTKDPPWVSKTMPLASDRPVKGSTDLNVARVRMASNSFG